MKKILLTSFAALMFTASADAGFYLGGYLRTTNKGMAEYAGSSLFNVIALDATVGYGFKNNVRLEADIASMRLDPKFGGFDVGFRTARALYDIKGVHNRIVPYFGFGLANLGWERGPGAELEFAGSFVGGVALYVANNIALDLQYSRILTTKIRTSGSIDKGANEFRLGMRYHF